MLATLCCYHSANKGLFNLTVTLSVHGLGNNFFKNLPPYETKLLHFVLIKGSITQPSGAEN